jgi:DNA-directed RNA polymerase subunit H (RpoH/RPB5)
MMAAAPAAGAPTAPYPPAVVVATLAEFFEARGLDAAAPPPGRDRVISDMTHGYVRMDATRRAPRGARARVVALVLSDGKYAQNGPPLRQLLEGVCGEHPDELDELILVAEEEFFGKKNVMDVFREFAARAARARAAARAAAPRGAQPADVAVGVEADAAGAAPYFSAHPYHMFAMNIPKHVCVPPHRVMAAAEVADLLASQRIANVRSLPIVFETDPPIVWCGGREGQVVEITRDSEVAVRAVNYRRIQAKPV